MFYFDHFLYPVSHIFFQKTILQALELIAIWAIWRRDIATLTRSAAHNIFDEICHPSRNKRDGKPDCRV